MKRGRRRKMDTQKIPDPFKEPEAFKAWVKENSEKLQKDIEKELKEYDMDA